jgi:hypothetical protein
MIIVQGPRGEKEPRFPIPEPNQEMGPLLDDELFDIDERGLGEDVAWHSQSIVQTSTELPKEVAVGIAAGTVGGSTCIIILIVIALVLGLGIGLGAGVGLGVGFGLQVCPYPIITSMLPKFPLCFDSNNQFYDLTIQGSNLIQSLDGNGNIIANPTISLFEVYAFPLNLTSFLPVNCSTIGTTGSNCGMMNTTGLYKSYFQFTYGYDAPTFKITNGQCTVSGSISVPIHAAEPTYISNSPFCISSNPSDPNFSPLVTLSVGGFISTATSITIGSLGTFPIVSMDNCIAPTDQPFKICKTVVIKPSGSTFQSYTQYPISFTYSGGMQPCTSNVGTIYGSTYASVTGVSPSQFQCGTTGLVTITGTHFTNEFDSTQTTFYLRDRSNTNAPLIAATDVTIISATSATASWSGLTAGKTYYVITKNGDCQQTQTGAQIGYSSFSVSSFNPDCTSGGTCGGNAKYPTFTIRTSGSLSNLDSVKFTATGSNNKGPVTYALTSTTTSSGQFNYNGGNVLQGSWKAVVTNTAGCQSSVSATVKWS